MRNSSTPNAHFLTPLRRTHGGLEIDGGLETAAHSQVVESLLVRQSAERLRRTRRIGVYTLNRQTASLLREGGAADKPDRQAIGIVSERHFSSQKLHETGVKHSVQNRARGHQGAMEMVVVERNEPIVSN